MNEFPLNPIAIYILMGLNVCLIFAMAFLFGTVHGLKIQVKQDENLVDKYNELVSKIANEVSSVEHTASANTRSIEYVSNIYDKREKELNEKLALLEKNLYDTLEKSISRLEKVLSAKSVEKPIDIPVSKPEENKEFTLESTKYEWKFCDDVNSYPVVGETYVVVGRVKGAAETEVECEISHYGQSHKFYKEDGTPFEKVFAYILMPKASDIQDRLFTLLKKDMRPGPGKVTYNVIKTPGK